MTTTGQTDHFHADFETGRKYEEIVAKELRREKIRCIVEHQVCRPTRDKWRQYSDLGDLVAFTASGGSVPISVKSAKGAFTGIGDCPYPNPIVSKVGSWERLERKPSAIVIVSRPSPGIIVIPISSKGHWFTLETRTNEGDRLCYRCPLAHCKPWLDFIVWLKSN